MQPVFITGNSHKAAYLAKLLGHPIEHRKLDLTEIQSLDFKEVVQHKLKEAYEQVGRPVLVEDSGIEFKALGRLPGTFCKWFMQDMAMDDLCRLVDGKDRTAIARCVYGYYDGEREVYFEGMISGSVSLHPRGESGFGWDSIFIPEGYVATRAELLPEDDEKTYLQIKPLAQVRDFLLSL